MFTWRYWREVLERAVKTAAQGALLAVGAAEGFDLFTLDLMAAVGFAGGGALLSVLTSLISLPVGATGSPSAIE